MRPWSSDEPARQTSYRRFYLLVKRRLDQQDDTIEYLMQQIKELREQIKNVTTNPKAT